MDDRQRVTLFTREKKSELWKNRVDIFIDKSFLSFVCNISQQSNVRSSYVLGKRKYTIFPNFFTSKKLRIVEILTRENRVGT